MFGTDSNPPVGHKLRELTLIRLFDRGRPPFRPRLDQVATPAPPAGSVIKSPDFPLAHQHYAPRMVVTKGLSPEMTGACRSPRKRERSERNAPNVNRSVHDSILKPGHT